MKNLILVTLLLGFGYSQCNMWNWQEYYNSEGHNMEGCNLSEVDLSGADLSGANLFYANLSGSSLFGADLSGADLTGANLSNANLYQADLSGANLSFANLSSVFLDQANLSGANLSFANLFGSTFHGIDLSGVCVEGAYWFTELWGYEGTPILEGCASGDGHCSYEDLDNDGYDDSSYDGGMLAFDTNNDGMNDNRPMLSIVDSEFMMMEKDCDLDYIDSGATCIDMTDGDISYAVDVSGDVVNMCIAEGVPNVTYSIQYSCTNSQGFTATDTRMVTVYNSYEQGFIDGAQSGDINGDGVLNIIDMVMYIDKIISE